MIGDEARVVDAFCAYLEAYGWDIQRELNFVDIATTRNGVTLLAEAKGRTSSPGLDVDTLYGQLLDEFLGLLSGPPCSRSSSRTSPSSSRSGCPSRCVMRSASMCTALVKPASLTRQETVQTRSSAEDRTQRSARIQSRSPCACMGDRRPERDDRLDSSSVIDQPGSQGHDRGAVRDRSSSPRTEAVSGVPAVPSDLE